MWYLTLFPVIWTCRLSIRFDFKTCRLMMDSFFSKSTRDFRGTHKFQPLNVGYDKKQESKYSQILSKIGISRILGATLLFIMGAVLFFVGIYWLIVGHPGSLPITFLGMICFVPGSYGIYEVRSLYIVLLMFLYST